MMNNVFVGCAGFTGRDWKGFFFPEGLAGKDELAYYSSRFNAVEINSTFYRKPRRTTLDNWYNRTDDGFKFFIKMPKDFTHIRRMVETAPDTLDFCNYITDGIREKLAGFLYQFPPGFHYNKQNLDLILQGIPAGFISVVEFRHESWWNGDAAKILADRGIVFAGVSYPGKIPDDVITVHPNMAYYRLHGVPIMFKSEYSEDFLSDVLQNVKASGREFYVFFNNTWGTAALKNALHLNNLLQ